MVLVYYYTAIITAVILYVNTVSIIKKVNEKQNVLDNTLLGAMCCIVFLICAFAILMK